MGFPLGFDGSVLSGFGGSIGGLGGLGSFQGGRSDQNFLIDQIVGPLTTAPGDLSTLFRGALSNGQGGLGNAVSSQFLGPLGDIFGSIFSGGGIDGTGDLGVLGDLGGLLGTILLGDSNILDGLQGGVGGLLGGLFGGGGAGGPLGGAGGAQGSQGGLGGLGNLLGALLGSGGAAGLAGLLGGSRNDQDPRIGSLNPAFATLLRTFGSQFDPSRGVVDDPANTGLFEGADFQNALRDLTLNAPGLFNAERALSQDFLNSAAPGQQLADAQGRLGRALSSGEELIANGFRTSAQPAFEEAERRLRQNILPQIAEIAGQNVGISSSSFLETANRAAADLLGEASLRQLDLDESAASRRASGLPVFSSLSAAQLGLQPAFANDLLALGSGVRNVSNAQQARPLDVFQILSGLGQGQQFLQRGFNPQGSGTTQLLAGLSSAVPDLLGQILGNRRDPFASSL